jgi:hypothetical protein
MRPAGLTLLVLQPLFGAMVKPESRTLITPKVIPHSDTTA